jgi:hypothetical protein
MKGLGVTSGSMNDHAGSQGRSLANGLSGNNMGGPSGQNQGQAPSQPANCPPITAVPGGKPNYDNKGCIVGYIVGLLLI